MQRLWGLKTRYIFDYFAALPGVKEDLAYPDLDPNKLQLRHPIALNFFYQGLVPVEVEIYARPG